jgi:hypothetical protein
MPDQERAILEGLTTTWHCFIAASESVEIKRLEALGYVEIWSTVGGFPAVKITGQGRTRLSELSATPTAREEGK